MLRDRRLRFAFLQSLFELTFLAVILVSINIVSLMATELFVRSHSDRVAHIISHAGVQATMVVLAVFTVRTLIFGAFLLRNRHEFGDADIPTDFSRWWNRSELLSYLASIAGFVMVYALVYKAYFIRSFFPKVLLYAAGFILAFEVLFMVVSKLRHHLSWSGHERRIAVMGYSK